MSVRGEITALGAAICKAVGNQDAAALASFYTRGAQLLPPGAPMIEGRASIEAFAKQLFTEGVRSLSLDTVDVLEGGNLAVEVGRFTMSFDPEGAENGKYIAVWVRQVDGELKMEVDTFNSDSPAA